MTDVIAYIYDITNRFEIPVIREEFTLDDFSFDPVLHFVDLMNHFVASTNYVILDKNRYKFVIDEKPVVKRIGVYQPLRITDVYPKVYEFIYTNYKFKLSSTYK